MIWYLRTTPASSTPSCHVLSSQPFYLHSLSTCISPTSVCLGKRCSCYSGWTALFFPNPISLDQEPTLFSWHVSPSQLVEHHFIDFCSPYYSPYQRVNTNFVRYYQMPLCKGCTILYSYQWHMRMCFFPQLTISLSSVRFLNFCHSHRWHGISVIVICISLMSDDEHIFIFMGHLYIFLYELSVHVFCPFFYFLFPLIFKSSLYIGEISVSLDPSFLHPPCPVNLSNSNLPWIRTITF